MARLQAQQTACFEPTRDQEIRLIANEIAVKRTQMSWQYDRRQEMPCEHNPNILDPSCGTGAAVNLLAELLGGTAWGNEIESVRAAQAKKLLFCATKGPMETIELKGGKADILFTNPPYDWQDGERLETAHLRASANLVRAWGLVIAVVPEITVRNEGWWKMWHSYYQNTELRRYPDDAFKLWKQYVVFGVKNSSRQYYTDQKVSRSLAGVDACGILGTDPVGLTLEKGYRPKALKGMSNAFGGAEKVLAVLDEHHVLDNKAVGMMLRPAPLTENSNPAIAARAEHLIQVAAAGGMDEQVVDGNLLISGGNETYLVRTVTEEGDAKKTVTTITHTEALAYQLRTLDLETGEFVEYDSRDAEPYQEFLSRYTGSLLEAVNAANPPQYNGDYSDLLPFFETIHGPSKLPGREENGALTAQKHTVAALVQGLEEGSPAMILKGDMGVGKTLVSILVMAAIGLRKNNPNFKVVVLAPAGVTPKWCREVETILSEYQVKAFLIGKERKQAHQVARRMNVAQGLRAIDQVVEELEAGVFLDPFAGGRKVKCSHPISDTIKAMAHPGPAFLVMSYEKAKNGSEWDHAAPSRRETVKWTERKVEKRRYGGERVFLVEHEEEVDVFHCPDCGEGLFNELEEGRPWRASKTDPKAEFIPKDAIQKCRQHRKQRACPHCSAPLWQCLPFKKGGRWPVAEFLGQHYAGRYSFILDEAHNSKGGDTNIGQAVMDLVSGATKTIAMTGTLYNGYAKSLFYLFYRLIPGFRELYAHDEETLFTAHHGLIETITKVTTKTTSSYGYDRSNESSRVRPIPGATPHMVRMMMPFVVFLTLKELGIELPPKHEYVVEVVPDESMAEGFMALGKAEKAACKAMVQSNGKNKGPHSRWFNAALCWPDKPTDEVLFLTDDESVGIPAAIMPAGGYAKDRELVKLVKAELAKGRGVMAFFQQVHRRNPMPRIQRLLESEGIFSSVLNRNTCKPEQRAGWILDRLAESRRRGQEMVLLCNGKLIQEGHDLCFMPTQVAFGQEYNIMSLQQMLARAHRLGQDREVKIYHLYYAGTLQEKAMRRIAVKLRAADQVDGEIATGLSEFNMGEDVFLQDLMKNAAAADGTRLTDLMQKAIIQDTGKFRPVLASDVGKAEDEVETEHEKAVEHKPPQQPGLFDDETPTIKVSFTQVAFTRGRGKSKKALPTGTTQFAFAL